MNEADAAGGAAGENRHLTVGGDAWTAVSNMPVLKLHYGTYTESQGKPIFKKEMGKSRFFFFSLTSVPLRGSRA